MGVWFHPVSSRRDGSEAKMFGAVKSKLFFGESFTVIPVFSTSGVRTIYKQNTSEEIFLSLVKSWSVYPEMLKEYNLKFQTTGKN